MTSHVAKLFLDCLMPLLALRQVQMVVGVIKGHQLNWEVLESFSKIGLLNHHIFFCIEYKIQQGIDRKRSKVEVSNFLIRCNLLNLVFFFIPS